MENLLTGSYGNSNETQLNVNKWIQLFGDSIQYQFVICHIKPTICSKYC